MIFSEVRVKCFVIFIHRRSSAETVEVDTFVDSPPAGKSAWLVRWVVWR